ncbi:uncharacterized protein BO97DRAFT_223061 [Aspergillus homomorphus CBS 101889]|uniref:Uncharacterized protein n=1 Tax=Aspergillus homomorphus (strain CBS 101889) TaxID=1450537 RepID=A0A395HKT1_ASPHC|nr:hypothetical protein BO97DRAFT_223061 [Aspergillus homomorphus CBS 101889]RAL08216.1 hypothetical protein BO97DRAFT_223061 [Aspergillus homomorphus CBS 101889]
MPRRLQRQATWVDGIFSASPNFFFSTSFAVRGLAWDGSLSLKPKRDQNGLQRTLSVVSSLSHHSGSAKDGLIRTFLILQDGGDPPGTGDDDGLCVSMGNAVTDLSPRRVGWAGPPIASCSGESALAVCTMKRLAARKAVFCVVGGDVVLDIVSLRSVDLAIWLLVGGYKFKEECSLEEEENNKSTA